MPRPISRPAFINHPELEPGEVFIANVKNPDDVDSGVAWSDASNLARYPWISRRVGDLAISGFGGVVPGHKPIFCDSKELIFFGIDPDSIWPSL